MRNIRVLISVVTDKELDQEVTLHKNVKKAIAHWEIEREQMMKEKGGFFSGLVNVLSFGWLHW